MGRSPEQGQKTSWRQWCQYRRRGLGRATLAERPLLAPAQAPWLPTAPTWPGVGAPHAGTHSSSRDSSLAHPLPPADGHPHGGRLGCDGCGTPERAGVPASGARAPPPAHRAPAPSAGHLPCPQPAPGHPRGRPHGPQDGGIDWLGEEAEQVSPWLWAAGLSLALPGPRARTLGGIIVPPSLTTMARATWEPPPGVCALQCRPWLALPWSPGGKLPNLPQREEAEAGGESE